ncbi:prestin-like isoform X3 [Haliotis cracherodii]|uniref:prestin-like isoform X3 n=1 Tax=Haliotis cracherodii TaxID=6455 RepID=UPI0039EBE6E4
MNERAEIGIRNDERSDDSLSPPTSYMAATPAPHAPQDDVVTTLALKRRVYTRMEIDEAYKDETPPWSLSGYFKSACRCSTETVIAGLLSIFPIVNVVRSYQLRQYILGDFLSGLSAAFLHLPQGLGFGLLASLAPVNGLYATFFPIVLYTLFGTSQHVSMGTNAVIALMTANIVEREGGLFTASFDNVTITDEEVLNHKVGVAMAVAFFSGLVLLLMGALRLGFLTMYLSVSFVGGFTTASAVHIATSQISKMLNIKVKAYSGAGKIILTYVGIFTNIANTNAADILIALICVAILLAVKIGINERFASRMKIPIPIDLIVVVLGTFISHFAELKRHFNIAIVGDVPNGLPVPSLPHFGSIPRIATEGFVISIIIFAMTISMAKLMARQHDYELDYNQELIAYGMSNFISSFFHCFPSCTAPPRTMILSSLGSRTTLNGIPSAIFILIVILAAGQLFVSLPIAVLAAMIVVAMKNLLLQIRQLPGLWRASKADFTIWIFTFLVGVLVDLDFGIIVGIGISIFTVIAHTQLTTGSITGVSTKEDVMLTEGTRDGTRTIPGISVFFFNSILYFANAEKFKKEIFLKVFNPATRENIKRDIIAKEAGEGETSDGNNGKEVDHDDGVAVMSDDSLVHSVIIDCSAMSFIDIGGVNVLKVVVSKYGKVDTKVYLACVGQYMWRTLHRAGFFDTFPKEHVFFDVWDAVTALQKKGLNGTTHM